MKNKKKRSVTLIEMMIVMFLIAMIIGVVAFNYRGSLDEGKAFKSKAAIDKIETILNLAEAEGERVDSDWQKLVNQSPLVQKGADLTKDGWGETFRVTRGNDGEIVVSSNRLEKYVQDNPGSMFKK